MATAPRSTTFATDVATAAAVDAGMRVGRVRSKEFPDAWSTKYGVQVAAREAVSGEVVSVKCLFCEHYGREGSGVSADDATRKRKRTLNVQVFKQPWRGDNVASHMLRQHAQRYAEYRALAHADKRRYFGLHSDDDDDDDNGDATGANGITKDEPIAVVYVAPTMTDVMTDRRAPAAKKHSNASATSTTSNETPDQPIGAAVAAAAVGMSRLVDSTSLLSVAAITNSSNDDSSSNDLSALLLVPLPPRSSNSSLFVLIDASVATFVCHKLLAADDCNNNNNNTTLPHAFEPQQLDASTASSTNTQVVLHVTDANALERVAKLLIAGFSLAQIALLLSVNAVEIEALAQQLCSIALQTIADAMRSVWAFTLVLDTGVASDRDVVHVRVRFALGSTLVDAHVVSVATTRTPETLLARVTNALDAVCGAASWSDKLVGIALDGDAATSSNANVAAVVTSLQQEFAASPGVYTVWSGAARAVAVVVQHALALVANDAFVATLVAFVHRSRTRPDAFPSRCPRLAGASDWRALAPALAWCVAHSAALQQLIGGHNASSSAWWIALYALHAVTTIAWTCVQQLESPAAHGAEQSRAIEQLLLQLVATGYVDGPSRFRSTDPQSVVRGDYRVTFESAEMFIKKQDVVAAAANAMLLEVDAAAHGAVVQRVAAMLADAANALATLRTARARMTGLTDMLPPVRPQELLASTSAYDLSRLVSLQRDRLRVSMHSDALDAIANDFSALLAVQESSRSDSSCSDSSAVLQTLNALPANASFAVSWRSVSDRFPSLCRFAGGLASVYRDPLAAFVSANVAVAATTDAPTREAALHAQQYAALRRLADTLEDSDAV